MADRRSIRAVVAGGLSCLLLITMTLGACSGGATRAPGPGQASQAPASGTSSSTTGAPATSASPAASGRVAVDETLLRFLPASVGTFALNYSAEATQDVVADPGLVQNAISIAYGLAMDSTTGDLVVVAVVRLRPGVFSADFYRGWRSSYDKAACAQAGSAGGNAEATIAGRTVFIGTCSGGAHSYHAYLEAAGVMISATSVGAKRFGEQLMGNLRP